MDRNSHALIDVGCAVRIRRVHADGEHDVRPDWLQWADGPDVITIVPPEQAGLGKLSPRTPLARALLGHRAGDVVPVSVAAGTVGFEVLEVTTPGGPADCGPRAASAIPAGGATAAAAGGDVLLQLRRLAAAARPVRLGDVVEVRDGELEEWWRVVSPIEADAARRLISQESPLGRALLGHHAGEVVRVRAPEAPRAVAIVAVWPVGLTA